MTHCSQCRTEFVPRQYPRFIRSKRDRMGCEANQKPVTQRDIGGKPRWVTWVERFYCDCGWKFQLRGVDVSLLDLLLPDYDAQQEIRRRAA
jgi:hypothetical protein